MTYPPLASPPPPLSLEADLDQSEACLVHSVRMVRVVIQVHPTSSKFIFIHWRLTWIKIMEWLVDPPGTTRAELEKKLVRFSYVWPFQRP